MNDLSLFLWLIDIVKGFESLSIIISVFAFLLGLGSFIAWTTESNSDEHRRIGRKLLIYAAAPLFFFFLSFAVVIPSKDTMYMIAASEIGEEVVNSDVGKKSLTILENKLDEILREQGHSIAKGVKEEVEKQMNNSEE